MLQRGLYLVMTAPAQGIGLGEINVYAIRYPRRHEVFLSAEYIMTGKTAEVVYCVMGIVEGKGECYCKTYY
jgi:hypothetical protein